MNTQNLWIQKLDHQTRVILAAYPTPLEYLPHISARMGREIFIKRDDGIGPGLGGNKTRALEYLLADAKRIGRKKVVTFGGLQSNHARITAAAALHLGMEPHLFYFEPRPKVFKGNLLLNQLLGAHMHFIPIGAGGDGSMTLETTSRLVRLVAFALIGRHFFIPVGGHTHLGSLGYVRASLEINQQARSLGIENAWLVTASGTGGTLAGLLTGFRLSGSSLKPLGIDVGKLWKAFPQSIAALSENTCLHLGESIHFKSAEIPLIEKIYAAPTYGTPSPACLEAIHLLAQLEGILLDPVYTGKAFAGLLDLLRQKKLGNNEPVIFLHTGGLPASFVFEAELTNSIHKNSQASL